MGVRLVHGVPWTAGEQKQRGKKQAAGVEAAGVERSHKKARPQADVPEEEPSDGEEEEAEEEVEGGEGEEDEGEEGVEEEAEEGDTGEDADSDVDSSSFQLPADAQLTPQIQEVLDLVQSTWPGGAGGVDQGDGGEAADDEQELEGAALLRMARAAWVACGESQEHAHELAQVLVTAAERCYIAPCLTLPRFSRLFCRMALAQTAARAARGLLSTAQHQLRHGDVHGAASSLRAASQAASSGEQAAEGGRSEHCPVDSGQGAAGYEVPVAAGSLRSAAAEAVSVARAEAAEQVLAPCCCVEARLKLAHLLLLDPADQEDLNTAEALLVSSLEVVEAASSSELDLEHIVDPGAGAAAAAGTGGPTAPFMLREIKELGKSALSKLCMLLCQEGRDAEAEGFLSVLGCQFRLSRGVLHYQMPWLLNHDSHDSPAPTGDGAVPTAQGAASGRAQGKGSHGSVVAAAERYVRAVDGAVPADMMELMQAAFAPGSSFWSEHGYNQDSPYFSYVHPLTGEPRSALDQVVRHIQRVAQEYFPSVADAAYAEWWAHCRPHGSGHQMHFDSDNEGIGEVRNPIISTVLYLSGSGIGGPTLVTDQGYKSTHLASQGWMVHPEVGRLTMFDGSVLHGVVPGRGCSPVPGENRVTFMVAFWKDIRTRRRADGLPGASQPLSFQGCDGLEGYLQPSSATELLEGSSAQLLSAPCEKELPGPMSFGASMVPAWQRTWKNVFALESGRACGTKQHGSHAAVNPEREQGTVVPLPVCPVWQALNPKRTGSVQQLSGLPKYDVCFQGF